MLSETDAKGIFNITLPVAFFLTPLMVPTAFAVTQDPWCTESASEGISDLPGGYNQAGRLYVGKS